MRPAQIVGIVVGVWLEFAPAVLGYTEQGGGDFHRIVGPLCASFALVAVWPATRALRWANLVLAGALLVAPLVIGHAMPALLNGLASAVALAAATPFGGRVQTPMGGGWRALLRPARPPDGYPRATGGPE